MARDQDAARVRGKLGAVLEISGQWDEALATLESAAEAYQTAGELDALGQILGKIGSVHGKRGTGREGIDRLQPLVDLLRTQGESAGLAALYTTLTLLFIKGGRYEAAWMAGEEAMKSARLLGDEPLQAVAEQGVRLGAYVCWAY